MLCRHLYIEQRKFSTYQLKSSVIQSHCHRNWKSLCIVCITCVALCTRGFRSRIFLVMWDQCCYIVVLVNRVRWLSISYVKAVSPGNVDYVKVITYLEVTNFLCDPYIALLYLLKWFIWLFYKKLDVFKVLL